MLILFIVCTLLIGFAVYVYQQEGSAFAKETNTSALDVMFDSNLRNFKRYFTSLHSADDPHEVLFNVVVEDDYSTYRIPAILLHSSGIHIVTYEKKNGWIVGHDRMVNWRQITHKNETELFENPFIENRKIVYALRDLFPQVDPNAFVSVVVFDDACSFQKIEMTRDDCEVMKQHQLKAYAQQLVGLTLTINEIQQVQNVLKERSGVPVKNKKAKKQVVASM